MNASIRGLILVMGVVAALFGTTNGCEACSVKGVCYSADEQWLEKCWTKTCIVDSTGYQTSWATSIVKTQCEDINGKCIDHGQRNSDGCTCNITGTKTEYICDGYGK
ncbi:uncharacterized protein LOC134723638 [Mytilus trossulus]|uniref:uncharacterized protein LOC134723638 n=1 Tax=Mytilus trossulus TaxID=6551 RepID=UPI003004C200